MAPNEHKPSLKVVLPDVDVEGVDWIAKGHEFLGKAVVCKQANGTITKFALAGRHPFGNGALFYVSFAEPAPTRGAKLSEVEVAAAIKLHQKIDKDMRMEARNKGPVAGPLISTPRKKSTKKLTLKPTPALRSPAKAIPAKPPGKAAEPTAAQGETKVAKRDRGQKAEEAPKSPTKKPKVEVAQSPKKGTPQKSTPKKEPLPNVDADGIDWIVKGHAYMGKPVCTEHSGKHYKGRITKYALEGRHPFGAGLLFHASFDEGPKSAKGENLNEREAAAAIKLNQTLEKEERMAARGK